MPAVVVTVTRTGGFAGLRREWSARPPVRDAPRWVALIDDCPWDGVAVVATHGADRFVWRIDARCGARQRSAELPDAAVEGPWRVLVDEVRDAAGQD